MVQIGRGFHRGANNNHAHKDQSNEEGLDNYQALSIDDSDDESPRNAQSSSEDKSHEERFNNAQPVSILDLPPEMMNEVGSHLSVVSQACLLLTCKKLYILFNYILSDPVFGFPYSDGLDEFDVSIRTDFLLKLESERWKYCAACLKLHPLKDFDPTSRGYGNPARRFCRWPGIIVLCPCLKVRPKRFLGLTKQHIPNWHQCQYSDPAGGSSYELRISLVSKGYGSVVFNFQYFIHVNSTDIHRARRRIMLCPHKDALQQIILRTVREGLNWTSSKRLAKLMNSMDCTACGIHPDVIISNDAKTYDIEFTREFYFGLDTWKEPPFDGSKPDYNWRRYSGFQGFIAHFMINQILGVDGLSTRAYSGAIGLRSLSISLDRNHRAVLGYLAEIARRQESNCYHIVHSILNVVRVHLSVLTSLALLLLIRYMTNGTNLWTLETMKNLLSTSFPGFNQVHLNPGSFIREGWAFEFCAMVGSNMIFHGRQGPDMDCFLPEISVC